jgi:Uma2 family endonuclease
MMVAVKVDYISPEEYLALEDKSPVKHEYIDGQVFAMSGVTDPHNTISLNLAVVLRNHLRGKGCRVFFADVKARIESRNCYYYPDVMVTCDPRDRETLLFKRHPCLIVEVLSDSTEAFDRGDKFADYRQLESLQEYVLINQKRQQVECFRRNAEGLWVLHSFGAGDTVELASVDFRIEMADLYEDVDFSRSPSSLPAQ